jgi:hypothetical protein
MNLRQNKPTAAQPSLHTSTPRRLLFVTAVVIFSLVWSVGLPAPNAKAAPDAPAAPAVDGIYLWDLERVDAPPAFSNMTDRSLALDRSDRPHLAYGGDHLYYTWHDGTQWRQEIVDAGLGVGEYASIAVDYDYGVHIAYYDATNGLLKYALRRNNAWTLQVIDQPTTTTTSVDFLSETAEPWEQTERPWRDPDLLGSQAVAATTDGGVGMYTSIAVDSDDYPHISYYDSDNRDLKYARWDGVSWDIEHVDTNDNVGKYSSLALDGDDDPHIAYYHDTQDSLRYANKTSGDWDTDTVDVGSDEESVYPGPYSSLAVSSSGKPYISYYEFDLDTEEGFLKYATLTSGTWVKEYVENDEGDDVGLYTSIALNNDGVPGISYYDAENQNLKYADRAGGTWDIDTVASSGVTGLYTSMVYAGSRPRISYYDSGLGALIYAAWDGDEWIFTTLAASRDVGLSTSLALDATGAPHISYFNDSTDDLKFTSWIGTSWLIEELDLNASGSYNSLALSAAGDPRIAYYRSGDLWYAAWSAGLWYFATVDSDNDVGQYTSLALDSAGNPHISYYDATNDDLRYAYWTGSAWVKQTLDSDGDVGQYTSIELDSNNNPHIAYYDATNQDLKYIFRDTGGTWHREVVDADGTVGQYTSLVLDITGRAHISYYAATYADLRYAARQAPGSWVITTLDDSNAVGEYTSIAIDAALSIHISYYDATNDDLKYIRQTLGGWVSSIVDATGDVGKFSSLAVTASGEPRISYYDATNGHLKYAAGTQPSYWLHLPLLKH